MSYPNINIDREIVIKEASVTSTARILHVMEDFVDHTVSAYVELGLIQAWVTVLTSETYFSDWSDEDVSSAVMLWINEKYSEEE